MIQVFAGTVIDAREFQILAVKCLLGYCVAEALELVDVAGVNNRNGYDVILGNRLALNIVDHIIDGVLDHGRVIGDREEITEACDFTGIILLVDALQDGVDLVEAGRCAEVDLCIVEGLLLICADLFGLQSLEDAHGDLIVVGEDPLGVFDGVDGVGVESVDEELVALCAAPAGVVGGFDLSDLGIGPAVLFQDLEESFVTHCGNG